MYANFSDIESLLSRFSQTDNSESVSASLTWSFAVSAAQTMVRLARIGDDEDPRYGGLTPTEREEEAKRFEQRLDEYGELISLFSKSANEDWLPTGKLVAELVQREYENDRPMDEQTLQDFADEMDAGIDDVKAAAKQNEERFKKEALLQIDRAKLMSDSIEKTVDAFLGNCFDTPDTINQYDAIRIANKLADKAAIYASNRLAAALRQPRKKRRDAMNADRRILLDIEASADELLSRLEHERDAAFLEHGAEAQA